MKCPYCGREMEDGVVQSARKIFFTTNAQKNWLIPDLARKGETVLSFDNWARPTCIAYHCAVCKKVLIDYSAETE